MMRKTIAALIIATLSTSPVLAQTSAAARAQQLEKLEEDLNSPDPNLRLAAFEVAMESSSLVMKTRAFSIALSSNDASLRSIAFSYKICSQSQISLMIPKPRYAREEFVGFNGGTVSVEISDCNPANGQFATNLPADTFERFSRATDMRGLGTMTGVRLDMSVPTQSRYNQSSSVCSIQLRLEGQTQLAGRLTCQNSRGDSFGPAQALANF